MRAPRLPSGPALARRRPRKREGAPGKVRQLKVSAETRDKHQLHEEGAGRKDSVSGKGVGDHE